MRINDLIINKLDLTKTQKKVLNLIMTGISNEEAAAVLNRSEKAVKFQVTLIFKAAGVKSRSELIVNLARKGWDFRAQEKTEFVASQVSTDLPIGR